MLTFNDNGFGILKYGVGCSDLHNNGVDSFGGERVRDTALQGDQRLQKQNLCLILSITLFKNALFSSHTCNN